MVRYNKIFYYQTNFKNERKQNTEVIQLYTNSMHLVLNIKRFNVQGSANR